MTLDSTTVVALCTLFMIVSGISLITLVIGIMAFIELRTFNKSTHRIQYIDPQIDKENETFLKQWATTDEAVDKQNKLYKEELETKMPEFLEEEDRYTF